MRLIAALLTAGLLASVALAAGSEKVRATLKPGEFRTLTTRSSFGAKQTLGVEVRVNWRVVPFTGAGTRSVTAATQGGVVVVVKTARKRGPAQVRMANASERTVRVVVEFGW